MRQTNTKQKAVAAARAVWREKIKHAHHLLGPYKLLPIEIDETNLSVYAAEFIRLKVVLSKALRGA